MAPKAKDKDKVVSVKGDEGQEISTRPSLLLLPPATSSFSLLSTPSSKKRSPMLILEVSFDSDLYS